MSLNEKILEAISEIKRLCLSFDEDSCSGCPFEGETNCQLNYPNHWDFRVKPNLEVIQ